MHSSWPEGRGGWTVGRQPSRAGSERPAAGGCGSGQVTAPSRAPVCIVAHEGLAYVSALEVSPGRKVNEQVNAFTL